MPDLTPTDQETVSLCEVLDRILNKGAVVVGDITISVAGIDLVYLGLQLVLTSIATARESMAMPCGSPAAVGTAYPRIGHDSHDPLTRESGVDQ